MLFFSLTSVIFVWKSAIGDICQTRLLFFFVLCWYFCGDKLWYVTVSTILDVWTW